MPRRVIVLLKLPQNPIWPRAASTSDDEDDDDDDWYAVDDDVLLDEL